MPEFKYQPIDPLLSSDPSLYRAQTVQKHGGHREVVKERHAVRVFITRLLENYSYNWNELYPHEQEDILGAITASFPQARFTRLEALNLVKSMIRPGRKGVKILSFASSNLDDDDAYEGQGRRSVLTNSQERASKRQKKETSKSGTEENKNLIRRQQKQARQEEMVKERLKRDIHPPSRYSAYYAFESAEDEEDIFVRLLLLIWMMMMHMRDREQGVY